MIDKIVMGCAICVAIVTVIAIVLTVLRIKNNKPLSKMKKILSAVLCVLMIAVTVANVVVYRFNNVIDIYFNKIDMNSKEIVSARDDAKALAEEVESEGIVLLKNSDNSLPLSNKKINLFGYTSIAPIYGGTGSGGGDESTNVDLYTALENQGFETNSHLKEYYTDSLQTGKDVDIFHLSGGDYNIYEPAASELEGKVLDEAKDFSDTAIVMIGRCGGEGGDLPTDMDGFVGGEKGKSYLELSTNEEEMINLVEENFDNVVVLINSGNPMELGFLDNDKIDAALWVGNPGTTGTNAIAKVLDGTVNPSGRLVDTYAYDITNNPAYYNSGDFQYMNTDSIVTTQWFDLAHYLYLDYQEGLYVGYRYYETRWVDNETGECDEEAYHNAVQFPFGYGLSYTNFDQKITAFDENDSSISMDVTVTNNGAVAGKDVVQIYNTAPYTVGGIEKSNVALVDYAKTQIIKPGSSETVHFDIAKEDLASYDYQGIKAEGGAYVLESGDYKIRVMANAHDELDSRTINVAEDVIYNDNGAGKRHSDMQAAVNHFDSVSYGNDISYITRADFEGTDITARPELKDASQDIIDGIEKPEYPDDPDAKEIVIKDNGLTIDDMKGLDYDDPKWELLLEQLSVADMVSLTGFGGFSTGEVKSIGKYKTTDTDGPAGINGLVNGASGIQYTSAVTLASTWNPDLAEKFGETIGNEAHAYGISGLYAPAMNIHRTAFGGRNFEYYSEDGVVSGKVAAGVVAGAAKRGIYTYIKHFAMDNQETNRENVCVWANEQAMREVYFKGFEIAVKQGKATAVMDSDARIGTDWCGGCGELNNDLLRNEWGFKGFIITDYIGDNFKDADIALYNGCDLMLSTLGETATDIVTGNITGQNHLRTACHNILYTIANSDAQELSESGISTWIYVMALIDIAIMALLLCGILKLTKKELQ